MMLRKDVFGKALLGKEMKESRGLGREKMRRKRLQERTRNYIWMRLGDGDDYTQYGSVRDAGGDLGEWLAHIDECTMYKIRRVELGIEVEGVFEGHNYVSLYVGGEDAEPTRELSSKEFKDFIATVRNYVGVSTK